MKTTFLLVLPGLLELDVVADHYKISGSEISFFEDKEGKIQVAFAPAFLLVARKLK